MADLEVQARIDVIANGAKQLRELIAEFAKLKKAATEQLGKTNLESINNLAGSTSLGKVGNELRGLSDQATKLGGELGEALGSLGPTALSSELRGLAKESLGALTEVDKLGDQLDKTAEQADKLEKETNQTTKATEKQSKSNKGLSNSFDGIKGKILGVVAGYVSFRGALSALNLGAEFGQAVAEIGTITELTGQQTDDLKDKFIELSGAFGTSASEQAKSYYQVVSAGITDAAEANDTLVAANNLATGGLASTEGAIDILTSTVNAFTNQTVTAEEASDILFSTVKNGKTTVSELSQSLGKVLPSANSLGLAFNDVSGSVATLTARGIKTREAVTSLNAVFTGIVRGQKVAKAEFKELGDSFSLASLESQGLAGFLQNVTEKLGGNQESLLKLFGSTEALTAINSLASDGFQSLASNIEASTQAQGSAAAAAEKIQNTVGFQIDALKANAAAIVLKFFSEGEGDILEVLKTLNESLSNFVKNFDLSKIIDDINTLIIRLTVFATAIAFAFRRDLITKFGSALGDEAGKITQSLTKMLSAILKLPAGFKQATLGAKAFRVGINLLKGAATLGLTFALDAIIAKFLEFKDAGASASKSILVTTRSIEAAIKIFVADILDTFAKIPILGKAFDGLGDSFRKEAAKTNAEIDAFKKSLTDKPAQAEVEVTPKVAADAEIKVDPANIPEVEVSLKPALDNLQKALDANELTAKFKVNELKLSGLDGDQLLSETNNILKTLEGQVAERANQFRNIANTATNEEVSANAQKAFVSARARLQGIREEIQANITKIADFGDEISKLREPLDLVKAQFESAQIDLKFNIDNESLGGLTESVFDRARGAAEALKNESLEVQAELQKLLQEQPENTQLLSALNKVKSEIIAAGNEVKQINQAEIDQTLRIEDSQLDGVQSGNQTRINELRQNGATGQVIDQASLENANSLKAAIEASIEARERLLAENPDNQGLKDEIDGLNKQLADTSVNIADLTVKTEDFSTKLNKALAKEALSGFNNAIIGAIEGTKSLKDGIADLGDQLLKSLTNRLVTEALNRLVGAAFGGGGVSPAGFASGGEVRGPGSGTSDSIPAMLSNKEFVVRAASVKSVGVDFLNAINRFGAGGLRAFAANAKMPGMSSLENKIRSRRSSEPRRFQDGGEVTENRNSQMPTVVNINNESSQPVTATSSSNFDGRSLIVNVVLEDIARNGSIARALKGIG